MSAVRAALRSVPDSLRAVARAAGISHALLIGIRDGTRAATPAVTRRLISALARLATQHAAHAARYRTLVRRIRDAQGKR